MLVKREKLIKVYGKKFRYQEINVSIQAIMLQQLFSHEISAI